MDRTRTVYTIINIIFGFLNRILNIVFPFLIRSVMIYTLGTEYLGLNTLFTSILQMLNLAELGISSAIVYSMYKPIAENNTEEVCGLLRLYRKIYRIIGCVILIIGMVIIPFLPKLIYGTYPEGINIVLLYLIYLINTVMSYFFFAYKTAIWNASQQISMIHNVNSFIIILQSITQIIILKLFKNYVAFLSVMPVFTLLNNIIISIETKRKFPQYVCSGNVPKMMINSIKQRVTGLFITKICITTRNSLDSIFISAFLGLNMVAKYGNYYYIMGAIFSIMGIITTSMTSSIGNSLVKKSPEKNYLDMRKFTFAFAWITGFCTIALLCLYQSFIKVWLGKEMLFPYYMVVLFTIYFYSLCLGSIRSAYHDAAGLWWEARYRAIAETIVNVVLNFLLTKLIGIAGTILSTILSILIVNYGYGTSIVFKYYFKTSSIKTYFLEQFKYTIVTIVVAIITMILCGIFKSENLILDLMIKGIVCVCIPNILFYFVYRKNNFFIQIISSIKSLLVKTQDI